MNYMASLFRWRNSNNLSTLCKSISLYSRSGKQWNIDPLDILKVMLQVVVVFDLQGYTDLFFFIRDQTVNICGRADHNVCVTTAQRCPCHLEAAADMYTCGFIPVFIYGH